MAKEIIPDSNYLKDRGGNYNRELSKESSFTFKKSESFSNNDNIKSSSHSSLHDASFSIDSCELDKPAFPSDQSTHGSGLQDALSSLGLKQENVEFIIEQGKKYLEKPLILSKKLKIGQDIAVRSLDILKSSTLSAELELTQEVLIKIEECLAENPEFDHEDISLLCEIEEELVSKYFELQPLSEEDKKQIREHYNKDISVENISNILKISPKKVKQYIEVTFVTFSGGEGGKVLDVIHKFLGNIYIPDLREKIRLKDLKLQDQLCCILKEKSKVEYEVVCKYFSKYSESKEFLKVDLLLTLADILTIKQSGKDSVEQLSAKLNKVESLIYNYLFCYSIHPVEYSHYTVLQARQLGDIYKAFGTNSFSFDQYRMIITHSFDSIFGKIEKTSKVKDSKELLTDVLPLAFYYLKCSLPFEDIARIIANLSDIILTTHDVFHLIFQLSDPVLKGLCIEHYSFSNAVPLYYPKLRNSRAKSVSTEFEICKELWYCLERYNGLISFGLGRASWNFVGKSSLLDMIFETDFVKGSPQGSAFHFRSIDIQISRNLFGESNRSSNESTKWAYIDCHGNSDVSVIQAMCSHLDVTLIHVCYNDYKSNRSEIKLELSKFKLIHVYLLIRDSDCIEVSISREEDLTLVFIPDLTRKDIKSYSIVKSLKQIGYEILHLNIENPQMIDSQFFEEVLIDLRFEVVEEIQTDKQLILKITDHIDKSTQLSHTIDFSFLNFYPSFVDYMSLYHQASYETDQTIIDKLNTKREQLYEKLNNTLKGDVVLYFNDILQRENSTLVLWKLSRELFHLSKRLIVQKVGSDTTGTVKEQKNDKYTLEIIWREALLSQKYGQNAKCRRKDNYKELFTSNFSKQVGSGEAFELIDGDNLRFFNIEIDSLLVKFYTKQTEMLKGINKGKNIEIKPAPIVVSIFGPQSSGKSTLLNYCFGCKFLTSAGRCTRGIYGSLSKLDRPVNLCDSFLILDTEGLDAIERDNIKDTSMIHFDRTMVLFCLAVSQVVIINVKGDIGSEMQNLLQICAFSLNRLKVSKVKAPKIFFVLNQQADPDPNKHLDAINLLMDKLNSESGLMETEGVKISELIQVSRENLFILPSAFNSQQMSKPGAKLFDSNVIKLSPTIAFADKCSKLRLAIVDQLDHMAHNDRAPFQTMSEWMEMAGVIWDTIIKYQDIVKYKNLEELMCSNKLSKVVSDLMEKYIYSNQKEFAKLTDELCKEIDKIESYLQPESVLTQEMMKFDEEFLKKQDSCLREFSEICQNDSLLKKMEHICGETTSNIKRLIYVVRKQYEDQLKLQIKSVLTEIQLSESMKNFQEAIIEHVDEYLKYTKDQQVEAFEDTWKKTFGIEDLKEEIRENAENFSNLYSIFRMEYNAMENKQIIHGVFTCYNFSMDRIIESIKDDLLSRFIKNPKKIDQNPKKIDKKIDQLIYPITDHHVPLKEMIPYVGRAKYDYLSQESLYKIEETWWSLDVIKRQGKVPILKPAPWIPSYCHSLILYCSGFESDPDIIWKLNKATQITLLASYLKNPSCSEVSTWDKFIEDITSDVLELLKTHPEVSHAVVKKIIHELKFRIKLANHEIGYIQAGLSNTAERLLSTYVFSLAFKFLWKKKSQIREKDKSKKDTKKRALLQYFLQKIENRKMVRGSRNHKTMAESDANISQKYAMDYIESVKRGLMIVERQNLKKILEDSKDALSHKSIFSQVDTLVSMALSKNPGEEVTNIQNIVVQYICNRNELLMEIFENKWKEIENTLYETISQNIRLGFITKTTRITNVIKTLLSELVNIAKKSSLRGFDSDSNFELAEFGALNSTDEKEIPFKAMNFYLKMYLDPTVSPKDFRNFFSSVFEVNGLNIKRADTYTLCYKQTELMLDEDTFKKLVNTEMFNKNELIFNLYEYVKQFNSVLESSSMELKQDEFHEMIKSMKEEFEKNIIGCPNQCPSCGKFCEREIHPEDGKCQIKTGHQISSMGGKVWNTDEKKTAVLFMCDVYKDHTQVIMPCGSMEWLEFKERCGDGWNWNLPTDEEYKTKQDSNHDKMKNIWNKFGRGILNYYREKNRTEITFVPYTTYEVVNQPLLSVKYYICFVIDGTGSMSRDIERARLSVGQLITHFASRGSSSEFRVVIYRDHCDDKILESFPAGNSFTPQQNTVENFLSGVKATGGGDFPEAVLDGLAAAAKNSDWKCTHGIRNKVIHIYDAPPHGDFPNYSSHCSDSDKGNCCCCNHGTKCNFDWERDVWEVFKKFNIEYHGVNTRSSYLKYEAKMKKELGILCGKFQVVDKVAVNEAILQIFVDYKM